MDKAEYYNHYQANIELLEYEITQVKKVAQIAIGKKAWQEKCGADLNQIAATEREIKAGTRLYTFLVCSWFEARLMKILYESSTVAFSDADILSIRNEKQMEDKWKVSFSKAVCQGYGFLYSGNIDYSNEFSAGSIAQQNYQAVRGLFPDISDAITIRNRLAHGQWDIQFNSANTAIANYSFLSDYDNIQKLDILKQCYNHIADIISAYVTYKNKANPNFDRIIKEKINLISEKKTRIQNSDYQKYAFNLGRVYEKQRNRYISRNTT